MHNTTWYISTLKVRPVTLLLVEPIRLDITLSALGIARKAVDKSAKWGSSNLLTCSQCKLRYTHLSIRSWAQCVLRHDLASRKKPFFLVHVVGGLAVHGPYSKEVRNTTSITPNYVLETRWKYWKHVMYPRFGKDFRHSGAFSYLKF